MGSVFSKPKTPKPPAPTSPTPTPVELDEEVRQKERDRRRQKISQAGRQGTILTGAQPLTGNASILGRSTV
jgi:hypothetical protein